MNSPNLGQAVGEARGEQLGEAGGEKKKFITNFSP